MVSFASLRRRALFKEQVVLISFPLSQDAMTLSTTAPGLPRTGSISCLLPRVSKEILCRCCSDTDCLPQHEGRFAFVASMRTDDYLMGLLELHCSLQQSNPGIPLVILGVEGDLSAAVEAQVRQLGEYILVEDVSDVPSYLTERFGKNWMKLRAWGLTQFDAVIMLDVDVIVNASLTHLFQLPTDFAWALVQAPDEERNLFQWNQAGFIVLRPCAAVERHMLELVLSSEAFQFRHAFAEQSFLQWYMHYTGWRLPMTYNTYAGRLFDGRTVSGLPPKVYHFADEYKPFNETPASPSWPLLCYQPRQHRLLAHRREHHHLPR